MKLELLYFLIKGNNKKVLVVGAGLAGTTIARVLAENNIKVEIIEKRNHVGGNVFDFINSHNERIHKYGPHILHCNKNDKALSFLSRFTEWVNYDHKVRALLSDGRTTPIPVNKNTIEHIFNKRFVDEEDFKSFINNIRDMKIIPKNTDEFFEANVGNKIADILFRPYTKKMWGIDPKELNIGVGARLSIKFNDDDRYFNDSFQALPKEGYTKMIENMLDHINININLNTNFQRGMELYFKHAFLCLPIDKFYSFKFGVLPYRSIIFEERIESSEDLEVPVINFTDKSSYTRKTQWNLFPNSGRSKKDIKTITYEKPCSLDENPDEYYYPVQTSKSRKIYQKYKSYSKNEKKITFCGRTGLFKYIDMIPAVTIHQRIAYKYLREI